MDRELSTVLLTLNIESIIVWAKPTNRQPKVYGRVLRINRLSLECLRRSTPDHSGDAIGLVIFIALPSALNILSMS